MMKQNIFYIVLLAAFLLMQACRNDIAIEESPSADAPFQFSVMEYAENIQKAGTAYTTYTGNLRILDVEEGYIVSLGGYTDCRINRDSVYRIENIGEHDYYFYNIYECSSDFAKPILRQVDGLSQVNFPSLEYGMSLSDVGDKRLSLHATAWANYALRMRQTDVYNPIYGMKGLSYVLLAKDPISNLYNPPYDFYMCHLNKDVAYNNTNQNPVRMDLQTSRLRLEITIPNALEDTSGNYLFLQGIEEIVAVVAGLPQTLGLTTGTPMPSDNSYPKVNHLLGNYSRNSSLQNIAGYDSLYGGGFALTPAVSGKDIVFTGETACFPQEEGAVPPELRVYLKYHQYGFIFVLYPSLSYTLKAGVRNVVSLTINSEQSSFSNPLDVEAYMVDRAYPLSAPENDGKAFMVDIYNKNNTAVTGRVCSEYVKGCDEIAPCLVYYAVKDDTASVFAEAYTEGLVFRSTGSSYTAAGTFSLAGVYTAFTDGQTYTVKGQYMNFSATEGEHNVFLSSPAGMIFEPYRSYQPYTVSDTRGSGILKEIIVYRPVKIGTQLWAASSMATIKTTKGTPLKGVLGNEAASRNVYWKNCCDSLQMYCYTNDKDTLRTTNGLLYNYFSTADQALFAGNEICPTQADWLVLSTYLGSSADKWLDASVDGGSNLSGFSALLTGNRSTDGTFSAVGNAFSMWLLNEDKSIARASIDGTQTSVSALTDTDKGTACSIRFMIKK